MKVQFNIKFHTKYGESLWLSYDSEIAAKKVSVQMKYRDYDYWTLEVDLSVKDLEQPFPYFYSYKTAAGEIVSEARHLRTLEFSKKEKRLVVVYDTWLSTSAIENVFYSAPFREVLLNSKSKPPVSNNNAEATHSFIVKAPLLRNNESVCLLGSNNELGNWKTGQPVLLDKINDSWVAHLKLKPSIIPFEYKYGVYDHAEQRFTHFENGENRVFTPFQEENAYVISQDGYIRLPADKWKGTGVAIPVFSLRSENGLGVGEFNDLKLLADWASKTGLKLIQILPVNDTTATFSWRDSYPYAAISAFALHPIYLNLEQVCNKMPADLKQSISTEKNKLNQLASVDYEAVLRFKISTLKKLFDQFGKRQLNSKAYKSFFKGNRHWLEPYAVFCYLRDKYKTVDYSKWEELAVYDKKKVASLFKDNPVASFYCFLQYNLHLQLREAVEYAHQKEVVLKGDIPIGVFRYGCDTWLAPELYHMHLQAGAPPDAFAVNGQNWGFPTYNWQRMQQNHFEWWQNRFEQMSHYFDAFRIDHILGFFRIWSIPLAAVHGILGYFDPSLSIEATEFSNRGIHFTEDRFCKPFINEIVLNQVFGENAQAIKSTFLTSENGFDYYFLPEFDNQRKLDSWFYQNTSSDLLKHKDAVLWLITNLLIIKIKKDNKARYYPRFDLQKTISYQSLPQDQQQLLTELYNDFFFQRQEGFWKEESLKKLPQLKAATNMLVCGEDLGLVPACVPEVMKELGILSLEIQRMPKQFGTDFFNPADASYLSVVSPSTHDMSTIRGWWEENSATTQRFYNTALHMEGEAPKHCEPWISSLIIEQHLQSPAMWSIFQLQDLMGIDESTLRENPEEERINIPADPQHYWRYRMHLTLEDLLKKESFNKTLQSKIKESGR